MLVMNYKIYFVGGGFFLGGRPENSKWNFISDEPISKLEYFVGKKKIIFSNYEAYNHIVERIVNIQQGQGEIISKVILMVKQGNKVGRVVFNMINRELTTDTKDYGKEYQGRATTGWKQGIKGGKPDTRVE